MKTLVFLCALSLFAVPAQQTPQPVVVPIENPSFEQFTAPLAYADPCGLEERTVADIPAWTFTVVPGSGGAGGLLQPNGESLAARPCNIPFAPDGGTVAFAQNTTISQSVQVPQQPSGLYTLKFFVASYFYWYPGEYTASLSLSTFYESPLCSISGHPVGDFKQIVLTCPVRDKLPGTMTVSLFGKGWPVLFDDVSLTFTP
jgi:hypothetical protein